MSPPRCSSLARHARLSNSPPAGRVCRGAGQPDRRHPTASLIPDGLLARATTAVPVGEPDPTKARQILQQAGVAVPVPIRVAYREGPAADKAMSALVTGWREGGFDPTLVPIKDSYFGTVSAPGATEQYDVFWSNWSPAWDRPRPSCPALRCLAQPHGGGERPRLRRLEQCGLECPSRADREHARPGGPREGLGGGRRRAAEDVAYIALAARSAVHLAGSDVRGLAAHPYGGAPSTSASRASTDPVVGVTGLTVRRIGAPSPPA